MRGRLEDEIAAAEREARAGRDDPALLVRLAQLYQRAGRLEPARESLVQAQGLLKPAAEREDGTLELAALWSEVEDLLKALDDDRAALDRDGRRVELGGRLDRGEALSVAEHDELIRLEVAAGVTPHPEPRACPACRGPLVDDPDGGGVRCARSGREGDLCRHVDAQDLYCCPACGLVVRAWSREAQGRFRADPHEPPLGKLSRPRCPLCNGPVADWTQHAHRCPKGNAAQLPRCTVCRQRGQHARSLACPRCAGEVATVPCMEGFKRRQR